jgi:tetraacyldisaccharide 4'-kinase
VTLKKILFFPFAVIYGIITSFRNLLYDWKFLKSKSFDVHTICVGNLAVGGTGKTPHVEYLVKLLQND